MNGYDLAREFLTVVKDIDDLLDKKAKSRKKDTPEIDKEIDILEEKMFEIKNKLKSLEF